MTTVQWPKAICSQKNCPREVNPKTAWYSLEGWGKPRAQGGDNRIALRRPTGKLMCDYCMTTMQEGLTPGQDELL